MKTPLCLALSLVVSLGAVASAAALVIEDFESLSAGNIDGQGGWRLTPQTGRSSTVQAGGLSYSGGTVSVNGGSQALRVDGSAVLVPNTDPATDFVGRNFSFSPSGNTTYFSFLLQLETSGATDYDGFINIGFSGADTSDDTGNDLTSNWSRISAGAMALRGGNDQVRGWNSSGGSVNSGSAWDSDEFSGTSTYLMVGRIVFNAGGNEAISFSYNPTDAIEGNANWVTVNQELGVTSLNYFGIFLNDSEPNVNNAFVIDHVAVGDSYAGVLAIPEPSTLALMGLALGGALLGLRRWR